MFIHMGYILIGSQLGKHNNDPWPAYFGPLDYGVPYMGSPI